MQPSAPNRRAVARGAAWAVPVVALAAGAPSVAASPWDCTPISCSTLSSKSNTSANPFWFGNDTTGSNADALWSLSTRRFTDGNGWVGASNSPIGTLHRNDTYWNGDARMSRVYQWQPGATAKCNSAQPAACTALTSPGVLTGESILLFSGDPLRAGMYWTYTSKLVCLAPGTYTFAFDYRYVGCWHRSQYLKAAFIRPSAVVGQSACQLPIGSTVTAAANGSPGGGTVTATVVVPYTSQWQWQYTWTSNDTEAGAGTLPCATCTPIGSTGRTECNLNTNDIGVTKPRCTGYSTSIAGSVCPTP